MTVRWTVERGQAHNLRRALVGTEPGNGQDCPPVDLLAATAVQVTSTHETDDVEVFTVEGTIVDRLNGVVEFPVTTADTASIGDQTITFEVTWPTGTVTYPLVGVDILEIVLPISAYPSTSAPPTGDRDVTLTYDADDVLVTVTRNPGGAANLTYDGDGNLVGVEGPHCDLTLSYDGSGRLEKVEKV